MNEIIRTLSLIVSMLAISTLYTEILISTELVKDL